MGLTIRVAVTETIKVTHAILVSNTNTIEPSADDTAEVEHQNNLDTLWTWSINGTKIAGSLTFFTGTIKLIRAVLRYWSDEVLTWWDRFNRRLGQLSSGAETSDEEEASTEEEDEYEDDLDEKSGYST